MIKPLIGIGSDVMQQEGERDRAAAYLTYVDALRRADALAILIPPQPENAAALSDMLDGVLLAGGADCDPLLYGEERHATCEPLDVRRQANDLALARVARESQIPTLGICLGMQIMNVAWGGSLVQDIDSQLETTVRHASEPLARVRHDIRIVERTKLATLVDGLDHSVNSSHHQAVARLGTDLRIAAHASDGIVEAIEDPAHPFYLGVQWHPEDMTGESSASSIFAAFVEAARNRAVMRRPAGDLSRAGKVSSE